MNNCRGYGYSSSCCIPSVSKECDNVFFCVFLMLTSVMNPPFFPER